MNQDPAWDRVVDAIDAKFGISKHGRYQEPLEDKPELSRSIAFIVFEMRGHTYKAERVTGPAIVDRKSYYHKAGGSAVRFENIYDPDEVSHRTNFYVQDGDDWQAIEASDLAL